MTALVEAPSRNWDGLPLETTAMSRHCTACGRELSVADRVTVYCYRLAEYSEWNVSRLYWQACEDDIVGTLGAVEMLVSGRLGCLLASSGRTHALCLTDVAVVASSGPADGNHP